MHNLSSILIFAVLFQCIACSEDNTTPPGKPETGIIVLDPQPVPKSNPMKIFAHYMPWFEDPGSNNGTWGIHWTMATRDPEQTGSEGKREIASYYYPLIGPYASGNSSVIGYHLLLMKYAGIDGAIIDWYGSFEVNDYPLIRRNTEALIDEIHKVGLEFSVMYEDRTTEEVVGAGYANSLIEAAQADMQYLQNNYFNNASYSKVDGAPLMTVFGPITIESSSDWTTILSSVSRKPAMLTLWGESADAGNNASGEFAWIWTDNSTLQNFYATGMNGLEIAMGSAYPGFKDFYAEGGWGGGSGWVIEHNGTLNLETTLELAANAGINMLQLATWNDFGEGTMIEPTEEYGFQFLEVVQEFAGVPYSVRELEKIHTLYELRQMAEDSASDQDALTQAFYHFVALNPDRAIVMIDSISQKY